MTRTSTSSSSLVPPMRRCWRTTCLALAVCSPLCSERWLAFEGKFRDLKFRECDAPAVPIGTNASNAAAGPATGESGAALSLEEELRRAEADFENGDYIDVTLEQLDRCVAKGEWPWLPAS